MNESFAAQTFGQPIIPSESDSAAAASLVALVSLSSVGSGGGTGKPKARWVHRCVKDETSIALASRGSASESPSPSNGQSSSPATPSTDTSTSTSSMTSSSKVTWSLQTSTRFEKIRDCIYLVSEDNNKKAKKSKESSRMICECNYEDALESGCGCESDCLNRLLYYECGPNCPCAELCTNHRFQKYQHANVEPFDAGRKGTGLKAIVDIPAKTFIMEYVGEIVSANQFKNRSKSYAKDPRHQHHYFMALKNDQVIDATRKGNFSRFINHSCDPNCETQKWTVNGKLRIGFFTIKNVQDGQEITFDYKFQRFGKKSQKCFCGSENCRGFIDANENNKKAEKELDRREKEPRSVFEDTLFDREFEEIVSLNCLRNRDQVVTFGRLMLRADDYDSRRRLIDLLLKTEPLILRIFVDLHGCSLLWSWMVDEEVCAENWQLFQPQILTVLNLLPIPHKNMLNDSKVLPVVERWAKMKLSEMANYTSEKMFGDQIDEVVQDLLDEVCCIVDMVPSKQNKVYNQICLERHQIEKIRHRAVELLQKWNSLKENFRIPRRLEKLRNNTSVSRDSILGSDYRPVVFAWDAQQSVADRKFKTTVRTFALNRQKNGYSPIDRKRPLLDTPNGNFSSKRSRTKEERRREFEQRVQLQDEQRAAREVSAYPLTASTASVTAPGSATDNESSSGGTPSSTPTVAAAPRFAPATLVAALSTTALSHQQRSSGDPWPAWNGLVAMPAASVADQWPPHQQQQAAMGDFGWVPAPGMAPATPSQLANRKHEQMADTDDIPRAIPAELVHDEATSQFWWRDQSSGILVYPASGEDQIAAYNQGDISRIPHFYYNPITGLIHEVQYQDTTPPNVETEQLNGKVKMEPKEQKPVKTTNKKITSPANVVVKSKIDLNKNDDIIRENDKTKEDILIVTRLQRINKLQDQIAVLKEQLEKKEVELNQLLGETSVKNGNISHQILNTNNQNHTPSKKLPKNWRMAVDADGKPYYYHSKTKKPQWEFPTCDVTDEENNIIMSPRKKPLPVKAQRSVRFAADVIDNNATVDHGEDDYDNFDDDFLGKKGRKSCGNLKSLTSRAKARHRTRIMTASAAKRRQKKQELQKQATSAMKAKLAAYLTSRVARSLQRHHSQHFTTNGSLNVNHFEREDGELSADDEENLMRNGGKKRKNKNNLFTTKSNDNELEYHSTPASSYCSNQSIISDYDDDDVTAIMKVIEAAPKSKSRSKSDKTGSLTKIVVNNQKPNITTNDDGSKNEALPLLANNHSEQANESASDVMSSQKDQETDIDSSNLVITTSPDTSSEVAKKLREKFKAGVSNYIIKCLNPYRKPDCRVGRITNNDDFKHLARKLTHTVLEKELKHCHMVEDLRLTDSVLHKAKDYIKRFLSKQGSAYKRSTVVNDDFA